MKFLSSIVTIAALVSSTEACQCLSTIGVNEAATKSCCRAAGGSPEGNQCPAGGISENLSQFAACCRSYGDRSDCRCSFGCARKKLEEEHNAQGLPPPPMQRSVL